MRDGYVVIQNIHLKIQNYNKDPAKYKTRNTVIQIHFSFKQMSFRYLTLIFCYLLIVRI